MTIFEFLSVAVSIVLALTLGRLIAATPHVFSPRSRDALHAGFFLLTTLVVLAIWWLVWSLSDKATWNFFEFLLMMASPMALYLAAQVLVSENPKDVVSWKEHFASIHRWYFGAILATILFAIVRTVWVLEADLGFAIGLCVLSVVLFLGMVSQRRSVHVGVLFIWCVFQIFAVSQRFTAA